MTVPPLPAHAIATYEFDLPWSAPPLSLNHRRHWRANAAKVRQVRDAAHILAKQCGIGPWPRVQVTLHYIPRDKRVRDQENPTPTLKAVCDGIVDAGIVKDDSPEFMVKDMPVIHPAASVSGLRPRLWVVITALGPEAAS